MVSHALQPVKRPDKPGRTWQPRRRSSVIAAFKSGHFFDNSQSTFPIQKALLGNIHIALLCECVCARVVLCLGS